MVLMPASAGVPEWLDDGAPIDHDPELPHQPRTQSVARILRVNPERWARVSSHQTRNAASVTAWRWRGRLRKARLTNIQIKVVRCIIEDPTKPFAVIMRYRVPSASALQEVSMS